VQRVRNLKAGLFFLVAFVSMASTADAAQRFVAPAGSGTTCSQAVPCPISTGVNNAAANDEVIVTPGTYTTSTAMITSVLGLSIHGQSGQPRPVINTSATSGLSTNGSDVTLRDLTINHTGTGDAIIIVSSDNLIDHVDVHSTSSACLVMGTVRDTLCASSGTGSSGLDFNSLGGTWDLKLRNVTAIGGAGNSPGMNFFSGNATTVSVDARNVIARGSGSAKDVTAVTSAASANVTVTLQSSNYDSVGTSGAGTASITAAGTGTNQTAPPVFTDTEFHQAAGSPTIDAGTTDAFTGTTTDLDGDPRISDTAIDIGADEFVPSVTPPPTADTTPPETTIDKSPKKKSKSKRATFEFSSTEAGSTFSCKVDANPAVACTSPLRLKLKRGKHTVSVAATDAAGNADATAATYSWKVKKKRKKPKG